MFSFPVQKFPDSITGLVFWTVQLPGQPILPRYLYTPHEWESGWAMSVSRAPRHELRPHEIVVRDRPKRLTRTTSSLSLSWRLGCGSEVVTSAGNHGWQPAGQGYWEAFHGPARAG